MGVVVDLTDQQTTLAALGLGCVVLLLATIVGILWARL